jgi:hypothetical protein
VRSFSEELVLLWEWADEVGHTVDFERLRPDYSEVGLHTFQSGLRARTGACSTARPRHEPAGIEFWLRLAPTPLTNRTACTADWRESGSGQ